MNIKMWQYLLQKKNSSSKKKNKKEQLEQATDLAPL